jgi:hypothetical protein
MSSRTVPKTISDLLHRCPDRKYCDTCIQERLGLKWRQQVAVITATLAVTSEFERKLDRCCTCQEEKQVIFATAGVRRATRSSATRYAVKEP